MNGVLEPVGSTGAAALLANAGMRCGLVALIGRSNVGKSTLLNRILGRKLAITSRKPQTTRHQLLGIHTTGKRQILFVDTPGMHEHGRNALNRYMNRVAGNALWGVDAIILLVEGSRWVREDDLALHRAQATHCPMVLAINKIDRRAAREKLLPYMDGVAKKHDFAALVPISALRGTGVQDLLDTVGVYLPAATHLFSADQITDRSDKFLAAEIIREKITRQAGAEVPYAIAVQIERMQKADSGVIHIDALILTERPGQKAILIGCQGSRIRAIGCSARLDLENLLGAAVMLNLWVKVCKDWCNDERMLRSLVYGEG